MKQQWLSAIGTAEGISYLCTDDARSGKSSSDILGSTNLLSLVPLSVTSVVVVLFSYCDNVYLRPDSITLSGRRQVRGWSQTC